MQIIEGFIRRLFDGLIAHPRIVLALFLIGVSALGWQARHFEIDISADTLLLKDNRHYIQTQLMTRRFAPQEFLLIAYKPNRASVFSETALSDIRAVSKQLRQMERVDSVRSVLNVPLLSLAGDLSSAEDPSRWTIEHQNFDKEQLRRAFAGHPLYENLLINKEQTATAIQVLFKGNKQLDDIHRRIVDLQQKSLHTELSHAEQNKIAQLKQEAKPLQRQLDRRRIEEVKEIRKILAGYRDHGSFYLGGVHVLSYQLTRIIQNDLMVFGGAITAMICLVLFTVFGKLRWVVFPIACCGASVIATMGLLGMLGLKATVISSNFIVLQIILTLALVIHLIVQYREYAASNPGWDQTRLVHETVRRKSAPIFYAGITTGVGFGSLIFSGIAPVIAFGWMMIIAVFVSIGVSLILFPAVMAMLDKEHVSQRGRASRAVLRLFAWLPLKHPALMILASVAVLAASVTGMFRLNIENSFIDYFADSTQVHQELSFIDRELGGSTPLDLVYTIPESKRHEELVLTADTVQTMQRIQAKLQQHDAIGKILSVVNFTELAKQINDGKPLTEYELTALYWSMSKELQSDLLGAFFDPEHHQARFSIRIQDTHPMLDGSALIESIGQDMETLGIPESRYSLTNLFILYQDVLQRLFSSQILTLGLVYVVLALTFFAIFRSAKLALIGIAPNILSTLSVLGLMGWLDIPLDLMTITIAAVAMGIAVDDTIHYVHRYREERAQGTGEEAVRRSHDSVGYAMLYTSLVVILGFSLLGFSDFVPSMLFGLLTSFTMAVALVFDLCVLPVLLRKFIFPSETASPA